MTTGPSSGHSESWYWLQSSHPATDTECQGDREPTGDTWGTSQAPCPRRATYSASPPPPQCEHGANSGCGPQGKGLALWHISKCAVTSLVTKNKIYQGGRISENSPT